MDMSNSFYYFFSATPQVLAATLALFGFFLIFKIQALKDELVEKARDILNFMETLSNGKDTNEIRNWRENALRSISKSIRNKNIAALYYTICFEADDVLKENKVYNSLSNHFKMTFVLHKNLIKSTLAFSIFTILVIVGCLSVIPFGKYFLCRPVLLQGLFIITIIGISISFIGLILILILALRNKSSIS